jgi:hypothetical protein
MDCLKQIILFWKHLISWIYIFEKSAIHTKISMLTNNKCQNQQNNNNKCQTSQLEHETLN